jgi:hypothetical protein
MCDGEREGGVETLIYSYKIFAVHGGIGPSVEHLEDIEKIPKTDLPDDGPMTELL